MAGPEVKVKVGADTSGLDKGLKGAEARLSIFAKGAAVAGAAVAATGAAVIALTKASLANIDATAKMARSIGLSTSALQDMSLVANEAGVETGKLTSMLGLMQRNISELQKGTKLQTDAFASMGLTIADLQGLSPDEQFRRIAEAMDGITDPTEKTARAMEVFGRGGRDAINMLSGYSQRIAEAEEFNRRFGISVAQDVSDGIERANDAVGRISMVFEGLGNQMAGFVAPAIEATANAIVAFAGHVVGAKVTLEDFFGTLERARDVLGEDVFSELVGNPAKIADVAKELEGLANQTVNLAYVAASAGQSLDDLVFQLSAMGASDAANEAFAIAEGLAQADREFQAGTISADEFRAKMLEATTQAKGLLTGLEGVDNARFGGVMADLGALIGRLSDAAGEAMRLRMNLPGAWEMAPSDGSSVTGFEPDPNAPRTRPQRPGVDSSFGSPLPSRGGGGGGGADPMTARLESLQEALATESEIVQAWYDESLETLTTAMERQMLTEEEYRQLRERLEKEHQERMAGIKDAGNKMSLESALSGGAEVLNAMGAFNKKALKIASVFAAGEALISTYKGAAKELEKGVFGFATAAAVIAKGLAFVGAIKSAGSSGGSIASGGGGGGAAPAPQAPAQQPLDVLLNTYGPGDFIRSADFGMMLDRLNETAGDRGYRLMMGT